MTQENHRSVAREREALDALDRLQREREITRQRRREANDAFDPFLKGFARPALARDSRIESAHASPATIHRGSGAAGSADRPAGPAPRASAEGTRRSRPEAAGTHPGGSRWTVRAPGPFAGRVAVVALAAVVLAAFVVFGGRDREPEPAPAAGAAAVGPAAPVTTPDSAIVSGAGAAAVADSEAAELTALRSVWVRVTVDGERVVERVLQADARVPLAPKETIVIRAGDGGAVRVSIGGRDQGPLGRDGEVVTRTFAVP